MRIACPACNAAYQVPDEHLHVGRIVRCARCGTDWAPVEAVSEPDPEPKPISEPEPMIEASLVEPVAVTSAPSRMMIEDAPPVVVTVEPPPPEAPKPRRGSPLLAIAWVLSLVIVIGALVYLVVARDRVMATWPPSARAYAALKLTGSPPPGAEKAMSKH